MDEVQTGRWPTEEKKEGKKEKKLGAWTFFSASGRSVTFSRVLCCAGPPGLRYQCLCRAGRHWFPRWWHLFLHFLLPLLLVFSRSAATTGSLLAIVRGQHLLGPPVQLQGRDGADVLGQVRLPPHQRALPPLVLLDL